MDGGGARKPFPRDNDLLQLILLEKPVLFRTIEWTYTAMWFTTPHILTSVVLSLAYIFVMRQEGVIGGRRLPSYPEPARHEITWR